MIRSTAGISSPRAATLVATRTEGLIYVGITETYLGQGSWRWRRPRERTRAVPFIGLLKNKPSTCKIRNSLWSLAWDRSPCIVMHSESRVSESIQPKQSTLVFVLAKIRTFAVLPSVPILYSCSKRSSSSYFSLSELTWITFWVTEALKLKMEKLLLKILPWSI